MDIDVQAASTLAEFAPGTSFQNVINEKKEGTKIEKVGDYIMSNKIIFIHVD